LLSFLKAQPPKLTTIKRNMFTKSSEGERMQSDRKRQRTGFKPNGRKKEEKDDDERMGSL